VAEYEFVTIWRVSAPIEAVWNEIYHSDRWPEWWKGVERVEVTREGDASGVGSVRSYTWKSKLPYRLSFEAETIRVESPHQLEARAFGELQGSGLWRLTSEVDATVARYDWKVDATKPWMRVVAPVARPLFEWNHDVIMGWGAQGLANRLGVAVVGQEAP